MPMSYIEQSLEKNIKQTSKEVYIKYVLSKYNQMWLVLAN